MDEQPDWQRWFDDHAPALVLLARQWCPNLADAEDAVQDAFIRAWSNKHAVRDPGAYLFQATRSAAMDLLRKRKRSELREAGMPLPGPMFQSPMEGDERRQAVETALATLAHEQREVLVMKVWGALTFAQIADVLTIPANTAASRYRYALQALKDKISEDHV